MTQPEDNLPDIDLSAEAMQKAEQALGQAYAALDRVINHVRLNVEPALYAKAQNTDPSVLFDFMKAYIWTAEVKARMVSEDDWQQAHQTSMVLTACAITRLMRNDDRMRADTVLAQLEKEINE